MELTLEQKVEQLFELCKTLLETQKTQIEKDDNFNQRLKILEEDYISRRRQ